MNERRLDLYEYAISDGEGTLLEHGIAQWEHSEHNRSIDIIADYAIDEELTIIISPCADDCLTGC